MLGCVRYANTGFEQEMFYGMANVFHGPQNRQIGVAKTLQKWPRNGHYCLILCETLKMTEGNPTNDH
jgi:hypothetical protein